MKTRILGKFFLLSLLSFSASTQAALLTSTLPQFVDTTVDATPEVFNIGSFLFSVPSGETVVAAKLSGQWGTDTGNLPDGNPTTNPFSSLFLDGILVAFTPAVSSSAWSFTFAPGDLLVFNDGVANLVGTDSTSCCVFAVGESTLELNTEPTNTPPGPTPDPTPVPEPLSLTLLGLGLAGLGLGRKKQRG